MHVAVVIPAFNVALFLPDTIRSVLRQTHVDWSMVVVDDGSTDTTLAAGSRFQDERIHLIGQPNSGVSAARNTGIKAVLAGHDQIGDNIHGRARVATFVSSPGEVSSNSLANADSFLFLDGDDWLASDALALLARALEDAPWAVAAVGRYARVGLDAAARLSRPAAEGSLLEQLVTRNLFANGGHVLIRREAIEAAGDFRPDLTYGEDWEYWTRLALLGEFVSVSSRCPLLFVRERLGGAYLSRATDPAAYRPALDTIFRNQDLADRLGMARLAVLGRQAEAEVAWTVGRELIRHGRQRDGLRWLGRSIRRAPSLKRVLLMGSSWLRLGPFHRYHPLPDSDFLGYRQCD